MATPDLKSQISNFQSQISGLQSQNYAVILAGGSGSRMQSVVPKQFLLLRGKPVLMHTIEAFHNSLASPQIILVLPDAYQTHWKQLCEKFDFIIGHQVVSGGETRFHSVKNALALITNNVDALVAIHDAVRPLTSQILIDNSYNHALKNGNAVTAVKSRDSVRVVKGDVNSCLIRENVYLIQTPQTFRLDLVKKAYQQNYHPKFTDDASVVEEDGNKINLIEGSYQNIKLTYPEDIGIAELIIKLNS